MYLYALIKKSSTGYNISLLAKIGYPLYFQFYDYSQLLFL